MHALLLCAALTAPVGADKVDEVARKHFEAGQKAAQAGQHADAEKEFAAAQVAALVLAEPKLKTDIADARTANLSAWLDGTKSGADKQFAANNLGVIYLQAGTDADARKAVVAFDRVKEPTGPGAYVFLANHARALDRAGDRTGALALYRKSLAQEPQFTLAAERAAEVIVREYREKPGAPRVAAARSLLDIPRLSPAATRSVTFALLDAWRDDAAVVPALAPYLVRYLVAVRMTPAVFEANEWPQLARLGGKDATDRLKVLVKELRAVFLDKEFGTTAKLLQARASESIPEWSKVMTGADDRLALAHLLHQVADDFRRRSHDPANAGGADMLAREAIQRDRVAFGLNERAIEALDGAVGTYFEHKETLDKDGELLKDFANELYERKSDLFYVARTAEQFRSLRSMHLTLAAIAKKQGKWGGGTREVPFQLRMAIRAEDKLRVLVPEYTSSLALSEQLVEAYKNGKNDAAAADAYREAADRHLSAGSPEGAKRLLDEYAAFTQGKKSDPSKTFPGLEQLVRDAAGRTEVAGLKTKGVPMAVAFVNRDLVAFGTGDKLVPWKVGAGKPGAGTGWTGALIAANPSSGNMVCDGGFQPDRPGAGEVSWWRESGGTIDRQWESIRLKEPVRALAISKSMLFASLGAKGGLSVASFRGDPMISSADALAETRGVAFRGEDAVVVGGVGGVKVLAFKDAGEKGKELWKSDPNATAECVAASAEGHLVAAGFTDGRVKVYDGATGKERLVIRVNADSPVRAVAFADGSNLLATLGADPAVRLWDTTTGREAARYGHPRRPVGMAFSADGRQLVIASDDLTGGAIRVWPVPGKGK